MTPLQFSKNVICPKCLGKICKIIEGDFCIHFKHKGSSVLAKEAIIGCLHCDSFYLISKDGIVNEVNIGK